MPRNEPQRNNQERQARKHLTPHKRADKKKNNNSTVYAKQQEQRTDRANLVAMLRIVDQQDQRGLRG